MHALPSLLAFVGAIAAAPVVLRALSAGGHLRPNFRGRELPFPLGVLVPVTALVALVPLMLLQRLRSAHDVFHPEIVPIATYVAGVMLLGLIDDVFGARPLGERARRTDGAEPRDPAPRTAAATLADTATGADTDVLDEGAARARAYAYARARSTPNEEHSPAPNREHLPAPKRGQPSAPKAPKAPEEEHDSPPLRGVRGHAAAALSGEPTTGALKAVGSLGVAMLAMNGLGLSNARWLLASAVLVLATHAFNLIDLRPGRTSKALMLLGAGLSLGSADARALWSLGLFSAPALVAGFYDLRERAMLGDTGASAMGALGGLWLVLTLSALGQLIALALLLALALYGELRSISALIERTPLLRGLDSLGRTA